MKKRQNGYILIDILVAISIMAVIGMIGFSIMKQNFYQRQQAQIANFYGEVNLIDSHLVKMKDTDVTISVSSGHLTVTNENSTVKLETTNEGCRLSVKETLEDGTTNKIDMKLNYIYNVECQPINTINLLFKQSGAEKIGRIPVKDAVEIRFNPTPPTNDRDLWFKEVLVYEF